MIHQASDSHKRTGHLLLFNGGTGAQTSIAFRSLYEAGNDKFACHSVYVDTEPGLGSGCDSALALDLTPEDADAVLNDPTSAGWVGEQVAEHYPEYLRGESIHYGSRTTRFLTQLSVEMHKPKILDRLRQSFRRLVKETGVSEVQPILIASTGGGAGSALVVLEGKLFADTQSRASICEGLSASVLTTPVGMLVEPFAMAAKHKTEHADKILANSFATRLETSLIERECFQHIFHLGLANTGGAMLDSQEEIAKVMAASVYQLCRNWKQIKARFVDTVDTNKIRGGYTGQDVPEILMPAEQHPAYAAAARPRFVGRAVFSPNGHTEEGSPK